MVRIGLARYRGSFNTRTFGEKKPHIGFCHEGQLELVYHKDPGLKGEKRQVSRIWRGGRAGRSWHESTESNRVLRNRSTSAQKGRMLVSEMSYEIAHGKSICCRFAQDANRHRGTRRHPRLAIRLAAAGIACVRVPTVALGRRRWFPVLKETRFVRDGRLSSSCS